MLDLHIKEIVMLESETVYGTVFSIGRYVYVKES